MNQAVLPLRPVASAVACALAQFIITAAILLVGRHVVAPESFASVKMVAFASTILFPLFLVHHFRLWKEIGLSLRAVRLEPAFLLCLLLVPMYLSPGLRQHPGTSLGGDLAIQSLNAFGEELLFRGVIFALLVRVPVCQAIALNGVLFGAMHLLHGFMGAPWPAALHQAMLTTLGGMMFFAVRLRSGSLWLVVGLHMAWNLAVMYSAATPQQQTVFQVITVLVGLTAVALAVARPGPRASGEATRAPG